MAIIPAGTTGLETGSISWAEFAGGVQNAAIETTTVHDSTYSIKLIANDVESYARMTGPIAKDEVFIRFDFNYSGAQSTTSEIFEMGTGKNITIQLATTLDLLYLQVEDSAGTVLGTGTTVVTQNAWHQLEMRVKKTVSNDGTVQIKLDGTTEINLTTLTTIGQSTGLNLLAGKKNTGLTIYFDNVVCNDTSGSYNNSWLGDVVVENKVPDRMGNYTDWVKGAGSDTRNLNVDELYPNDSTDCNRTSTFGAKETYGINGATTAKAKKAVICRVWDNISSTEGATLSSYDVLVRYDSTDYLTNILAGSSYAWANVVYDKAPDGTDWTNAKINATETGRRLGVSGTGTWYPQLTTVGMVVIYDWSTAEEGPAGGPAFMSNRAATGVGV